MERVVYVVRDDTIQARMAAAITQMRRQGLVPQVVVSEYRDKRSLEQNAAMWSALTELSQQVDWYGHKLTPEAEKHADQLIKAAAYT